MSPFHGTLVGPKHPIRFAVDLLPAIEFGLVQLAPSQEHNHPLTSLLKKFSTNPTYLSHSPLTSDVASQEHFSPVHLRAFLAHRLQIDDTRFLFTSTKGSMPVMTYHEAQLLFPDREIVTTTETENTPWDGTDPNDPNVILLKIMPTLKRNREPEEMQTVTRLVAEQQEYENIRGVTKAGLLLPRPLSTYLMLYFRGQIDDIDRGSQQDGRLLPSQIRGKDLDVALLRQADLFVQLLAIQDRRAASDFKVVTGGSGRHFKVSALEVYLDLEVDDPVAYMDRVRHEFRQVFRRAKDTLSKAVEGAKCLACQMGASTLVKLYIRPDRKIRFEVVFYEDHPLNLALKESRQALTPHHLVDLITDAFMPFCVALSHVELRSALGAPDMAPQFRERVYEALKGCRTTTRWRMMRYLLTLYRGGLVAGSLLLKKGLGDNRRLMGRLRALGLAERVTAGAVASSSFYRAADPYAWWGVVSGLANDVILDVASEFKDLVDVPRDPLGEATAPKKYRTRYRRVRSGRVDTTDVNAGSEPSAVEPDFEEAA